MTKETTEIPRGSTREDRAIRRKIIQKTLEPMVGTTVNCPCLGNVPVEITKRGVSETIHHASKSYASTMAAIHLKEQIRTAQFSRYRLPKDNRQSGKMGFSFTIELHGTLEGRRTKLMIGVTIKPQYFHYCITSEE